MSSKIQFAEEEAFGIKVMRLVPPNLCLGDPRSLTMATLMNQSQADANGVLSPSLCLSPNFGYVSLDCKYVFRTLYFGDTFRAYVCITNLTAVTIKNVTLKVEMQTSLNRTVLLDSSATSIGIAAVGAPAPAVFLAQQTRDHVISHLLSEFGLHCLVCTINFSDSTSLTRTISKFFKFSAERVVQVKSNISAVQELMFVESRVTNITSNPIFVCASFSAFSSFVSGPEIGESEHEGGLHDSLTPCQFLAPGSVFSLVFPVSPISDLAIDQASSSLGELRIFKKGVENLILLYSEILNRPNGMTGVGFSQSAPFDLVVISAPKSAVLDQVFAMELEIRNLSKYSTEIKLYLRRERMGPILPLDNIKIVYLEAHACIRLSVRMIAVAPGVQNIGGWRLTSDRSAFLSDLDVVHSILILKPELQ